MSSPPLSIKVGCGEMDKVYLVKQRWPTSVPIGINAKLFHSVDNIIHLAIAPLDDRYLLKEVCSVWKEAGVVQ